MNTKKVVMISLLCLLALFSISITITFGEVEPEEKKEEKRKEEIKTEIEKINNLITNMNTVRGETREKE